MDDVERREVLIDLEKAVRIFTSNEKSHVLIPEVRTNIGYALTNPSGIQDVAAIPGRITVAFGKAVYCLPPAFGASDHIARVILTAMKYDKSVRSAMNIALYPQFFQLNAYVFDRLKEPNSQKHIEGKTMNLMMDSAVRETGGVPEFIIDKGDFGKEPGMFVLGKNPNDVITKALQLLSLL